MIDIGRRAFCKDALFAGALVAGGLAYGCNVWQDIETYVPIGVDALDTIVSLLDPPLALLVVPISTLIKAGFADLAATVDDYIAAPAVDKATLAGKIKTILAGIATHFQNFLAQLGQYSGLANIASLVTLILETLAGYAMQIPAAATAIPARLVTARITLNIAPVKRKKAQFIQDFNAKLDMLGYPASKHIPLTH